MLTIETLHLHHCINCTYCTPLYNVNANLSEFTDSHWIVKQTYLVTDILLAESRKEPRGHLDIFPLGCARSMSCWFFVGRLWNTSWERPRQGFSWGSVCSGTEHFCRWWKSSVGNCCYGRARRRNSCFCEWTSSWWFQCITLVVEFVLTYNFNTFHWWGENNLWTRNTNCT